jgi:hypothetical protein
MGDGPQSQDELTGPSRNVLFHKEGNRQVARLSKKLKIQNQSNVVSKQNTWA